MEDYVVASLSSSKLRGLPIPPYAAVQRVGTTDTSADAVNDGASTATNGGSDSSETSGMSDLTAAAAQHQPQAGVPRRPHARDSGWAATRSPRLTSWSSKSRRRRRSECRHSSSSSSSSSPSPAPAPGGAAAAGGRAQHAASSGRRDGTACFWAALDGGDGVGRRARPSASVRARRRGRCAPRPSPTRAAPTRHRRRVPSSIDGRRTARPRHRRRCRRRGTAARRHQRRSPTRPGASSGPQRPMPRHPLPVSRWRRRRASRSHQ